jgi:hypothetical protein
VLRNLSWREAAGVSRGIQWMHLRGKAIVETNEKKGKVSDVSGGVLSMVFI